MSEYGSDLISQQNELVYSIYLEYRNESREVSKREST